jgi:putative nucleotidyltransferase-like protein
VVSTEGRKPPTVPRPSTDRPDTSRPALAPDRALEQFAHRIRDRPLLRSLDEATAEAFDAFDAAGVDALLLKGPALARKLYGPLEHRGYTDVDLLVSPADAEQAGQIFRGLEYMNTRSRLGIDDIGLNQNAETWVSVGRSREPGLMVDLHQQLRGAKASPQAAWNALSRSRAWIELAGRRVPTLNADGLALHVALHAAQHGALHHQPLEDLVRATETWSLEVWRGASRLAQTLDATQAFAAGLRQVPQGAQVARDLGLPPTDQLQWWIAHEAERPRGALHLRALSDATSMRERASVLRRALLPSRKWLMWQYPWARDHGVRLAIAYVAHLMRTPLWVARAWRFRRRGRRAS